VHCATLVCWLVTKQCGREDHRHYRDRRGDCETLGATARHVGIVA
jgi:hypothetical protein